MYKHSGLVVLLVVMLVISLLLASCAPGSLNGEITYTLEIKYSDGKITYCESSVALIASESIVAVSIPIRKTIGEEVGVCTDKEAQGKEVGKYSLKTNDSFKIGLNDTFHISSYMKKPAK